MSGLGRRRSIPAAAATILLLMMLFAPGAAANPFTEPWSVADPVTTETHDDLDPVCAEALRILREEGVVGSHTDDHDPYGYEGEWLDAPACRDLRDEAQWGIWEDEDDRPHYEHCRKAYGTNCVVVGHYACDVGVQIATGIVYWCWGGLFPYN